MIREFVTWWDKTGRSPVPTLADVPMNLSMDETASSRAVQELGHRPETLAIKAVQAILAESTPTGTSAG